MGKTHQGADGAPSLRTVITRLNGLLQDQETVKVSARERYYGSIKLELRTGPKHARWHYRDRRDGVECVRVIQITGPYAQGYNATFRLRKDKTFNWEGIRKRVREFQKRLERRNAAADARARKESAERLAAKQMLEDLASLLGVRVTRQWRAQIGNIFGIHCKITPAVDGQTLTMVIEKLTPAQVKEIADSLGRFREIL